MTDQRTPNPGELWQQEASEAARAPRPRPKPARARQGAPQRGRRKRASWRSIVGYGSLALLCLGLGAVAFLVVAAPIHLIRDRVVEVMRERAGRELVVAGGTSVSLFPKVTVALGDVSLAAPQDMPGEPTLSVGALEVEVGYWSLLPGGRRLIASSCTGRSSSWPSMAKGGGAGILPSQAAACRRGRGAASQGRSGQRSGRSKSSARPRLRRGAHRRRHGALPQRPFGRAVRVDWAGAERLRRRCGGTAADRRLGGLAGRARHLFRNGLAGVGLGGRTAGATGADAEGRCAGSVLRGLPRCGRRRSARRQSQPQSPSLRALRAWLSKAPPPGEGEADPWPPQRS